MSISEIRSIGKFLPCALGLIFLALVLSRCGNFDDLKQPIITPTSGVYNWSSQSSYTISKLRDVFFINGNQGWVVGDSLTLLSTTDGGINWPQVPTGTLVRNLMSVFFIDSKTGWVTSGSDSNPTDGHVFISKMGGAYPTQQQMVDRPLNTVFFLDKNTGWAAGDSSVLIHTINAGETWTQSTIGSKDKIYTLQFLTPEIGWAGASKGKLFRTKDGTTWKDENLGITADIHAIHFLDTLHGWACGSENTILRRELDSTNKPVWITSSIPGRTASQVWSDIFFVDIQTGWVVGAGASVFKTIDGGITWNQETVAVLADLNAIYMVSASKGWIVGESGNILIYTP